jgi:DNA invertase Pin-like site-specific DNA recombinase
VGRLLFNVLAMAEFEADLICLRTREGMKVAKTKGRLRGKQPKHTTGELADLFSVGRSTVYRSIERDDRRVRG